MAHQYWQFYFLPFVAVAMTMCWRVLRESAGGSRTWIWRAVPVVAAVEMIVASAYWLHFRHTREETYAIEHTAEIRQRFLLPEGR
jgi:hypothetical protein